MLMARRDPHSAMPLCVDRRAALVTPKRCAWAVRPLAHFRFTRLRLPLGVPQMEGAVTCTSDSTRERSPSALCGTPSVSCPHRLREELDLRIAVAGGALLPKRSRVALDGQYQPSRHAYALPPLRSKLNHSECNRHARCRHHR